MLHIYLHWRGKQIFKKIWYFEKEWEAFLTLNDMHSSLILSEATSSRHADNLEELQATLKSEGIWLALNRKAF